jgi:glycosyltransferase involved in cell wall biosynthesis
MPPAVSIVVPTFDRLEYLRPALDSVFAQTFDDWNLIIADDGSGEELRGYLRDLGSRPRVKVVWLPRRGVPAAVRNAALREANGTHVAFLDSDDVWAPRKLERQVALRTARPECAWSYTAFRRVDHRGAPLAGEHARRWHPHQGDIFEQLVSHTAELRTPTVMIDRQLLNDVGGFDESMRSGEDYDLWMRLALRSPVAVIEEPLVDVRHHDRNYSRDWAIAFDGRDRSLAKLESLVDPRRAALLRRERARNGAKLVAEHARRGDRVAALRAFAGSATYAWSYPEWWWRSLRAAAGAALRSGRRDPVPSVDRWNTEYAAGRWAYIAQLPELARLSVVAGYLRHFAPAGDILDLGCGAGFLLSRLQPADYRRYVGVDFSAAAIDAATALELPRATFLTADVDDYRPTETFDAIVFTEVLYYLADPVASVQRYARHLGPRGVLVVSANTNFRGGLEIIRRLQQRYATLEEVTLGHPDGHRSWVCLVLAVRR